MAMDDKVTRVEYLGRLLDGVDFVLMGRRGSLSEDRWLQKSYDPRFSDLLIKQLGHSDPRVRSETVLLLGRLGERAALGEVRRLRREDGEAVSMACLSYLSRLEEEDDLIPGLMETLRSGRGDPFMLAARRMGGVGRAEDVPGLREVLGGLGDERAKMIVDAIDAIIDRNPELQPRRTLLTSRPVFPDEDAFSRFLDKGFDYIDRRYRESIHPRRRISTKTHRNLLKAFGDIHVRLYNEEDNLIHYHPADRDRHQELLGLLDWALGDLRAKEVEDTSMEEGGRCPSCGGSMFSRHGSWVCGDCGRRLG